MQLSSSPSTPYGVFSEYDARLERLRRRRLPIWRLIAAGFWDFLLLLREAYIALIGFVVVSAISTLYLLYGYHDYANSGVPPFQLASALYETMRLLVLETGLPLPVDDPLGDVIFFIVPLLGLALVFQSILNFGRLLLDKASRREDWQVALARTFHNHVVVCGLGSVSYRAIVQLLEAGYEVVAIERDWEGEYVEAVLELKVPVIQGDARNRKTLREAGVLRARAVLAGIHDDMVNVEIGLAVRRKRPDIQVVLRIFNDELDVNLERSFGTNTAFSASALAAPTLAVAAVGRAIAHVVPLPVDFAASNNGRRFLGILQVWVAPQSALCGPARTVEERFNVRIVRHIGVGGRAKSTNGRASQSESVGNGVLEQGDALLLLGPLDVLEQIRVLNDTLNNDAHLPQRAFGATLQSSSAMCFDTVIVCGLGKIGYRAVKSLYQLHSHPNVTVICRERETPGPFIEEVQALGVRIIDGDARRIETLQAAGIDRACSVAAVASDDLVNLQIGLAARRLHPDIDIVLRVSSDVLAERLTLMFGMHTSFSVAALAAPTLAAATVAPGTDYAIEIGGRLLSIVTLEVQAGDEFAGRSVDQVHTHANVQVIALRQGDSIALPPSFDTQLHVGDEICVLVEVSMLDKLRAR